MKIIVSILAILGLSLALAACGGGSSSSTSGEGTTAESSGGAGAEASTEAAEKSAEGETGESEAGSGKAAEGEAEEGSATAGGLTPPGAQLKVGEEATLAWVPPGEFEPAETQNGVELKATVVAIEEGSTGDLKNIELEPDDEGATPFYVRLKLEAPSNTSVPPEEDPAYSFTAIDDRKEEQPSVTFLGEFEPCEDVTVPHPFSGGVSYETCLTYLMQGGGKIEEVRWDSGPAKANEVTPYFEEPVVWTAGG
jgi:hypothetical protein